MNHTSDLRSPNARPSQPKGDQLAAESFDILTIPQAELICGALNIKIPPPTNTPEKKFAAQAIASLIVLRKNTNNVSLQQALTNLTSENELL